MTLYNALGNSICSSLALNVEFCSIAHKARPDTIGFFGIYDTLQSYKSLTIKERTELALSENIAKEYRQHLLIDQWNVVRCYFARRADLSAHEVEQLLDDDDHVIRLCIAKRDDLTPEMVSRCVADKDPNVRHAIARNPLLTQQQREILLKDIDDLVRLAAKKGARKLRYRQREGQAKLIR